MTLMNAIHLIIMIVVMSLLSVACNIVGSDLTTMGEHIERGVASWYGSDYHGTQTASGEIYNMERMTAAHPHLPFDSVVRVVNRDNGRHVIVRINDRGPFVQGRVIDLSRGAAREIGILERGLVDVDLYLIRQESVLVNQ